MAKNVKTKKKAAAVALARLTEAKEETEEKDLTFWR